MNEEKYIIKVYDTMYLHFNTQTDNTIFRLTRDIKSARIFHNINDALISKDSMDKLAKDMGEYPLPNVEIIKL